MELRNKNQIIDKTFVFKPKRNLDNSELIKHFGKGKLNIWKKDIETGASYFDK
jgi:hypothetical protein